MIPGQTLAEHIFSCIMRSKYTENVELKLGCKLNENFSAKSRLHGMALRQCKESGFLQYTRPLLSRFAIGGVGYMHGWLIQKKILYSDYPWGVPNAQRRERACQSFARGRLITATESDGSSALPGP